MHVMHIIIVQNQVTEGAEEAGEVREEGKGWKRLYRGKNLHLDFGIQVVENSSSWFKQSGICQPT